METLPVPSEDSSAPPPSRTSQWLSDKETVSRVLWGLVLGFGFVLAWALNAFAGKLLRSVPAFSFCPTDKCAGKIAVFRVSFVLTCFYGFFALVMIKAKQGSFRHELQLGYWWIKIIAVIGVLAITFFIPNPFFVVFAEISQFLAGVFILIQIILLVDFAYVWNEAWVAKERFKSIIASSVLIYIITIVLIALSYTFFTPGSSCGINTAFVTVTLILVILVTLISIKVEHGAILTSSVVCVYCSYLDISSMLSEPSEFGCNTLAQGDSGGATQTVVAVIGLIIMAVALVYSAMTAATSADSFSLHSYHSADEGSPRVSSYSYTFFHTVFCLSSMYMANVLVGWNISDTSSVIEVDKGWTSVWIKMSAQWVTFLLYGWTLIAPVLFPNRDFS